MSAQTRKVLLLGVATAVLAGLVVPSVLGASRAVWDSKVSSTRYDLDRQRDSLNYLRDQRADSIALAEIRALALEILCAEMIDPTDRRCPRHE